MRRRGDRPRDRATAPALIDRGRQPSAEASHLGRPGCIHPQLRRVRSSPDPARVLEETISTGRAYIAERRQVRNAVCVQRTVFLRLYFLDHHIALTNPKEVNKALDEIKISFVVTSKGISETFLNGISVEKKIRKMRISENVSQVSALKDVRVAMVAQQRKMGKEKGVVMDGRDIGTVVFPNAELKLFMKADILIRAFRRQRELLEKDRLIDLDEVIDNILLRDKIDTTRAESPLRQAEDAFVIDTTHIAIDEQVDEVVREADETTTGPASFIAVDPDGNPILVDQHV